MKRSLILVLVFIWVIYGCTFLSFGQNLIPNSGFEEYHSCPYMSAQIDSCKYWRNFGLGSADYFNGCAKPPNGPSVPLLWQGYQISHGGYAMAGFYASQRMYSDNSREYIQIKLLNPLDSGQVYYVSFFVNLKDNSQYSVGTIGMYFSDSIENPSFVQSRFKVIPQVVNTKTYSINDTASWTRIDGTFTPEHGNLSFITIGNFSNDSNSRIMDMPGQTGGNSYYFIDDVCISVDPDYCQKILHSEKLTKFNSPSLYPNPVPGKQRIQINLGNTSETATIQVVDLFGNVILLEETYQSGHPLQITATQGIYFVRIETDARIFIKKLIVNE